MSISPVQENLLTGGYALLKQSGLLETSVGRRLFKSAYFFYKRHIEDDLQDLVRSHPDLLSGGNILDIGANVGYTATVLAQAADSTRTVYAFEPEAFNYQILQGVANGPRFKDRIVAVRAAVGAGTGVIELWLNRRHHADHRIITEQFRSAHSGVTGESVPIVSIDQFLGCSAGTVSFVKIDVQGYELAVCEGMKETLEKNLDLTIVLEYMPSAMRDLGFNPRHLIRFLADRGFEAYSIRPKGRLSKGIPPTIEVSGYVDLLFSRRPMVCESIV